MEKLAPWSISWDVNPPKPTIEKFQSESGSRSNPDPIWIWIRSGSDPDPIQIRSGSDPIRIRSGSDPDPIRIRSGSDPDPIGEE